MQIMNYESTYIINSYSKREQDEKWKDEIVYRASKGEKTHVAWKKLEEQRSLYEQGILKVERWGKWKRGRLKRRYIDVVWPRPWPSGRMIALYAAKRDSMPGRVMPETLEMMHAISLLSIQQTGRDHES